MEIRINETTVNEIVTFASNNSSIACATICFDNDRHEIAWHIGEGYNWEYYTYICEIQGCANVDDEDFDIREYVLGTIEYRLSEMGHELVN